MSAFDIHYAAHTATCTFLLDSEGICRRLVVLPGGAREAAKAAQRCIGAQYVASLDPNLAGMLAEMPRVGTAMLFARTDERGKISLVRSGQVTRFERYVEDPFTTEDRPSESIATSAPPLTPSVAPTPRRRRETDLPPAPIDLDLDPYQEDATQRLRASDIRALRQTLPDFDGRATWPSPSADVPPPPPSSPPPTVRTPVPPPLLSAPPQRMRSDVVPRRGVKPAIRKRG